jgi:hypothetical protein
MCGIIDCYPFQNLKVKLSFWGASLTISNSHCEGFNSSDNLGFCAFWLNFPKYRPKIHHTLFGMP